jgi:hypothetical protein
MSTVYIVLNNIIFICVGILLAKYGIPRYYKYKYYKLGFKDGALKSFNEAKCAIDSLKNARVKARESAVSNSLDVYVVASIDYRDKL